ncbi:MAG: HEAT repeat domain-containing protein [Bdellovibrionales bacterium]|nr:HEAT repeat domain-containing protein [Bdellovibrionales bacterium]
MKIFWQSSRKCSTPERAAALLFAFAVSVAAVPAPALASTPLGEIREDLADREGRDFTKLLVTWKRRYGTAAVPHLLKIARDRTAPDPDRYISTLAVARLGGGATAEWLAPLLKDGSWMVRMAALRALTVLREQRTAPLVLALLRDPALVVRREAAEAVAVLKPAGSAEALLESLKDHGNYRNGKAQWVPQRALDALTQVGAPRAMLPALAFLLDRHKDPDLQRATVRALDRLSGEPDRAPASTKDLAERVKRWKDQLTKPSAGREAAGAARGPRGAGTPPTG